MPQDARIRKFLAFPVEPQAEWQGGVFELGDLEGDPFAELPLGKAKMALWVSSEATVVHAKPILEGTPLEVLIETLMEFVQSQDFGYRPEHIRVTDKRLAQQLAKEFADSGTNVTWQAEPSFWCEVKAEMTDHLLKMTEDQFDMSPLPALVESGCTEQQLRDFAQASAAFYRAAPWQYLTDVDLLKINAPKPLKHLKHATVMGAGKTEYGVGFYDSPKTHWRMRAGELDMDSVEVFSLTFQAISEAFPKDVALWKKCNLPLETGDAFPQLIFYSKHSARPPQPEELEFVTIVLATLAETTEADFDSGQWSKQVSLLGKKSKCQISLPDLLHPPTREEWLNRGIFPESRANERHFRLVNSVLQKNEGLNIEQMNELLQNQFSGPIDRFEYPAETRFDRAENLCQQAFNSYGRRRIQLVRQALLEDPTHVEANLLLGESIFDLTQKLKMFRKAVELGEAQQAEMLKLEVGNFWGIIETRPLMRAKYGLAQTLVVDGQVNEAIAQLFELLRLNPNDNQGVRNELVPLLLRQNRESEASEVLDSYREATASWLYLKTQIEYRRVGPDGPSAMNAMADALNFNSHVVELLTLGSPPAMPDRYQLQSPEEAAVVVLEQWDAWFELEGFIDWMYERFVLWKKQKSKRKSTRRTPTKKGKKIRK